MKVVILAGGLGTRIKNVEQILPKSLIRINGIPFIEHQLIFFKKNGFKDFILCLGYKSDMIINYLNDKKNLDLNIQYSIEQKPLGTGGALINASQFLPNTFLLLNGDTYFDCSINNLLNYHNKLKLINPHIISTLASLWVEDLEDYGSIITNNKNIITSFNEKIVNSAGKAYAGIGVFEKRILDYLNNNEKVSLEREIIPFLINEKYILYNFNYSGKIFDMGTPLGLDRLKNHIGRKNDFQS